MESQNKKIKNAQITKLGDIQFKSVLESRVYQTLKEHGFDPQYEPVKFVLFDGFEPKTKLLTHMKIKRINKHLTIVGDGCIQDSRSVHPITYTPDFIFVYQNKTIIVEVKGIPNDVFPLKFKMFRKYIDEHWESDSVEIWEIFSKKQLLSCINLLKK